MRKERLKNFQVLLLVLILSLHSMPLFAEDNLVEDLMNTVTKEKSTDDLDILDEEEKVVDTKSDILTEYFDMRISVGGQSAFSGDVTLVLEITPYMDSPKTQVLWDTPNALVVKARHKEFINMQKGVTYTLKASVSPQRAGVYPVTVSATSWQHDTNYTNSTKGELAFNSSLILQPTSQSYIIGNIVKYVGIFLIVGILIFAGIKIVKKYTPKAKKWFTPPI